MTGSFDCSCSQYLNFLKGAPKEVGENFNCASCSNLISLKGAPKEVGGNFYCHDCSKITSLQYATLKCKIYNNNFEEYILNGTNINTIEADKYLLRRILLGDFSLVEAYSDKNKIKPLWVMRDFDLLLQRKK